MNASDTTIIAGIVIPSTSPVFLAIVAFHVLVGLVCVVVGIAAMLSPKRRGRHSRLGTTYYWSLAVVFASASALAAMRWYESYHLFLLGVLAFAAATVGRRAMRRSWPGGVRLHLTGMGLSYILLLTAFYVDNGKNLPLWKDFHPLAYWLLPAVIGLPLIGYALVRHPMVRRSNETLR